MKRQVGLIVRDVTRQVGADGVDMLRMVGKMKMGRIASRFYRRLNTGNMFRRCGRGRLERKAGEEGGRGKNEEREQDFVVEGLQVSCWT